MRGSACLRGSPSPSQERLGNQAWPQGPGHLSGSSQVWALGLEAGNLVFPCHRTLGWFLSALKLDQSQAYWHKPVIPAPQEAGAGGLQVGAQ